MKRQKRTILRDAQAGLKDRGDIVVTLQQGEKKSGIQLDIKSRVINMFGQQIRESVL